MTAILGVQTTETLTLSHHKISLVGGIISCVQSDTPNIGEVTTIYSKRCSMRASRLFYFLQYPSADRSFLSPKCSTLRLSSSISPLLHSRRRTRIILRPALDVCRRSSTCTIPSTRLSPSMHLNRTTRRPNTKQSAKHHVNKQLPTILQSDHSKRKLFDLLQRNRKN